MVKVLYLGLFTTICALAALSLAVPIGSAAGATVPRNSSVTAVAKTKELVLSDDGSVRSERSTNLSHITGSARKIQMYVKNRHLQILPDGTVNATSDDTSDYTILQRTTVNIGQLKIQGVATCQYLCMDSCGLLYGSREFVDECVFNEMIEQHHYNTYSSARYSNSKRTMYLALNRRGQPRKVQIRARQQLGKLSAYTRVLTKTVNVERVEELLARLLHGIEETSVHPLRHHGGHLCAIGAIADATPAIDHSRRIDELTGAESPGVDRVRCRKRKKRKKKRRRCHKGEDEADGCVKKPIIVEKNVQKKLNYKTKKCEHDSDKNKCQRLEDELITLKKKRKPKSGEKQLNTQRGVKKKTLQKTNKNKKVVRVLAITSSPATATESTIEKLQMEMDAGEELTTVANATVGTSFIFTSASTSAESGSVDESVRTATDDSEQLYDDVTSAAVHSPSQSVPPVHAPVSRARHGHRQADRPD